MDPYKRELQIAIWAAQRASILTDRVYQETFHSDIVNKTDSSPVTIGDYGAQALIISALKHNFPRDMIVAEEDSTTLRHIENTRLLDRIWHLVNTTNHPDPVAEISLGGSVSSVDAMLQLIDAGQCPGGDNIRFWTVDPIDGTKGFLRGGQYSICIGLVINGKSVLGVLGCPNLPITNTLPHDLPISTPQDKTQTGVLFSAVAGHGAVSQPLWECIKDERNRIHVTSGRQLGDACFCESFDSGHSNHEIQAQIATKLGIVRPSVRMDSQAKYASVARGVADIYIALPRDLDYKFKVWDHVPGEVIVKEAGGIVTDFNGNQLDFKSGRSMVGNLGVIAAPVHLYEQILNAVQEVTIHSLKDRNTI